MNNFKPYVGQKVRLNDFGYYQIDGIRSREAFKQAENMIITDFENINAYSPLVTPPIWAINVDQPEINMFLLDTTMVTPLEGLTGEARVLT